jgi:hypothetical protein
VKRDANATLREDGLTQRERAELLGVNRKTIERDDAADKCRNNPRETDIPLVPVDHDYAPSEGEREMTDNIAVIDQGGTLVDMAAELERMITVWSQRTYTEHQRIALDAALTRVEQSASFMRRWLDNGAVGLQDEVEAFLRDNQGS